MHQNHLDTLARIKDPVVWWDVHGAPHWDMPLAEARKTMRYIECQECGRKFWVKLTDCYDCYRGMIMERNIPYAWHYGDPPYHVVDTFGDECHAGYCMNSIPEYEWSASPEQTIPPEQETP